MKRNTTPTPRFYENDLAEDVPDYSDWQKQCFAAREFLSSFDKQPGNYAVEKIASLLPENPECIG